MSKEITKKQYQDAMKIVNDFTNQEVKKIQQKQNSCKHSHKKTEVSEWHGNGNPDRWRTFCKDCGKILSS